MQIHISPRHLKLTAAIHGYVAEKIGHLEHYEDHIMGAHVVLWHDETRGPKNAFVIKVHLAVPGPDVYGEDHGHDLYQAIDIVVNKLAQQLRHRKSKLTKGRRDLARKAKARRQALRA